MILNDDDHLISCVQANRTKLFFRSWILNLETISSLFKLMLVVGNPCCQFHGNLLWRLALMKPRGMCIKLFLLDPFNYLLIFSSTCRFFVYTFPVDEAEIFIKADLRVALGNVDSKLLYFLDFALANGTSIIPEHVVFCIFHFPTFFVSSTAFA